MERLIEFAGNHLALFAALAVTLFLIFRSLLAGKLGGYKEVSPQQATQLINREEALVLDVREPTERSDGHVLDSLHIPLTAIDSRLYEVEKEKHRPIIVMCRTGARSSAACAKLKKAGIENLYSMAGGVLSWQSANLPLMKK